MGFNSGFKGLIDGYRCGKTCYICFEAKNGRALNIEAAHSLEIWCPSTKPYSITSRKTATFIVTSTGTSIFVDIVIKNELPEKTFTFVVIRKERAMDGLAYKRIRTTDMHPNIIRRNGLSLSRRWMPLSHTLRATRQQEFSNSVIDPTSRGQMNK